MIYTLWLFVAGVGMSPISNFEKLEACTATGTDIIVTLQHDKNYKAKATFLCLGTTVQVSKEEKK